MNKKMIWIFLGFFLVGVLTPLRGLENISVKEEVYLAKDEVQDNIIAFGGDIIIEGRVKENVVALGGTIVLSGEVGDTVLGIGSTITLRSTAVIRGDLVSLGGVLNKEPGCLIQGDTVYFKSSELLSRIFRGGIFSFPFVPLLLIFKVMTMFVWLLLAIVVVALFPRQLAFASGQIRSSFWPTLGVGALTLVVFITLLVFSALLSILLIGIPFLLFLIAVGLIIKIFGQVVLFYFFGESIGRAFGSRTLSPLLVVVIGLVVVSLITLVPFLGFLFSFCLGLIAWGAVIRTKFGTTENWLRKKA
ncbi:MAG: hypothetical protein ACUVV5_05650 [Candidatus Aminicenantales bacterium]